MKISIDYVSKLDRPFFQYSGQITQSISARSVRLSRSAFGSPGIDNIKRKYFAKIICKHRNQIIYFLINFYPV